ncbi:MAG: hypothetical protein COB65_02940 [Thalassobium sp.]|nr:MAG: hypothetical protein COB65_02940 [Thalassobium sp.]
MKKVKNYIEPELAKKKIARYKYWSIKDEGGITICTSDENNPDNKSFAEVLNKIVKDNVDAEVQIRYGTSDQSSRQNPPLFIKINEKIEWVEPEEDSVSINGTPHRVDKNGNVNINLTSPDNKESGAEKAIPIDTFRQEIDLRLEGIQREHQLKEEKWAIDMQNKLMEQTLKFREMMLAERESRLLEREQSVAHQENNINRKKQEIQSDVASYLKQVPSALGAIIKEFATSKKDGLGKSKEKPKRERQAAEFTIEEDEIPTSQEDNLSQEEIDAEIAKYDEQEKNEVRNYTNSSEQENDAIEFEETTPSVPEQNKSSPDTNILEEEN